MRRFIKITWQYLRKNDIIGFKLHHKFDTKLRASQLQSVSQQPHITLFS